MIKPVRYSFFIKKNRILQNGKNSVFLRFYGIDKNYHYYKIGLEIEARHWDPAKEKVKHTSADSWECNNIISLWRHRADLAILKNGFISFNDFINVITTKGDTDNFLTMFETFIDHLVDSRKHTKGTI